MQGSPVVLQVGPDVISRRDGRGQAPAETVAVALEGIDDPVVLLDERPVRVDDLLRSLIAEALGGRYPEVVVLHPAHWPVRRVARVCDAVRASADRVTSTSDDPPPGNGPQRRRRIPLRPMVIGGVVGTAAFCGVAGLLRHPGAGRVPEMPITAAVVEGRVAVEVPDGWTVERLTRGPGSRRVRVASPADPDQALHITQSYAPGSTLADAAGVLARAAAGRPEFTDFRAADAVGGRPAISYREVRAPRVVRWVVLLDGATRISIGCQSRLGAEDAIRSACEQAIRSAREIGGTAPGN